MPNGAAQNTTEDVAAPLITRQNAIGSEEDKRPRVVGEDAQGDVGLFALAIACLSQYREMINNGAEEVGIEDRFLALHHHRETLKTHARVDIFLRQRCTRTIEVLIILHEDEVPDLQEALAITTRLTISPATTVLYPAIIINLRVWSTRSRSPWRSPPVIFQAYNRLIWITGHLVPIDRCFIIIGMDRGIQTIRGQAYSLCQKLPGKGNRLTLKVIADREIAKHLEKGQRALIAHLVDIGRAEAFLC